MGKGDLKEVIFGASVCIANLLALLVHVFTIVMAFNSKGFFAAVLSFVLPVLSEIYWFVVVARLHGVFSNLYTLSIVVIVGLYAMMILRMSTSHDDR